MNKLVDWLGKDRINALITVAVLFGIVIAVMAFVGGFMALVFFAAQTNSALVYGGLTIAILSVVGYLIYTDEMQDARRGKNTKWIK